MARANTFYGDCCPTCGNTERYVKSKKCVHCHYQRLSKQFMGRKGVGNGGKQKDAYSVPTNIMRHSNGMRVSYD